MLKRTLQLSACWIITLSFNPAQAQAQAQILGDYPQFNVCMQKCNKNETCCKQCSDLYLKEANPNSQDEAIRICQEGK